MSRVRGCSLQSRPRPWHLTATATGWSRALTRNGLESDHAIASDGSRPAEIARKALALYESKSDIT